MKTLLPWTLVVALSGLLAQVVQGNRARQRATSL
jgi:hypothetical protein